MNTELPQTDVVKKHANLIFDWHKLIIFCLLLAVSYGYTTYLRMPKIYESKASIVYQQQRINPSRLSPDDEKQFGEMVNTTTQQVMSRSSLERIIREFDLYPELRTTRPIEDVIEQMRNRDVLVEMGRGKGNVFTVAYQGRDPQKAMRVANALASRFIEENLRLREERVMGTTRYIQDELRMSKEVLDKQEGEMRDYKLKHYNEMPDQRASNMSRLNALQEQFQSTQRRMHELEQTRNLISEQIENRRDLYRLRAGSVDTGVSTERGRGRDDLSEARRNLQEMLARYTEEHPAVKRAENRVRQLEAQRAGYDQSADGQDDGGLTPEEHDPRINELGVQLREIEMNLQTLRSDSEKIREQMEKFQKWIDMAPVREAEWSALTRNYNQLKNYHDNLLSQSLAAEAAESLEKRQQGSQFKVVDAAYLPTTPVKGSFTKILFMAIGAGLAVGVGFVVLFSFLDTSFKDAREMEDYLEVPVTCAIPQIVTREEQKRQTFKNSLWLIFFGGWLLSIMAATVYFYIQGEIII